jgi:hypothetical protein
LEIPQPEAQPITVEGGSPHPWLLLVALLAVFGHVHLLWAAQGWLFAYVVIPPLWAVLYFTLYDRLGPWLSSDWDRPQWWRVVMEDGSYFYAPYGSGSPLQKGDVVRLTHRDAWLGVRFIVSYQLPGRAAVPYEDWQAPSSPAWQMWSRY